MAFKYINPGYMALLDSNNTGATQVADKEKSKTGVGFSQIYNDIGITINDLNENDELWGKFDFFVKAPQSTAEIYCLLPCSNYSGFCILYPYYSTSTITIRHYYNGSYINLISGLFEIVGFRFGAINTVTFHAILGNSSTAKLELWVGDNKFVSTGRAMPYSTSYKNYFRLYAPSNVTFSNIIFSSEKISPKEQTLALPISATETDMTLGDNGIYIADAANQSLLQSVDVSSLIENYGASSAITGIQLVGNPAYKTAEGLANVTALSKLGNVITEHKTRSLSNDASSVTMDGWKVENMTIAGLSSMKFGWKVGE